MATSFSIVNNIHGRFVTCQRPIVVRVRTTSTTDTVAHYRGKLFVEDLPYSGNFVDTEIRMNGYSDDGDDFFSFNLAEYCSNYFEDEPAFYEQNFCLYFRKMLCRQFILQIEPVLVANDGSLFVDEGNIKETKKFVVTSTNTMVDEENSTAGDYIRMDKFVCNGANDSGIGWFNSAKNKLTTNMPQHQVIDVDKGFFYFLPIILRNEGLSNRTPILRVTNNAGLFNDIPLYFPVDEHIAFHIHPWVLSFWFALLGLPNINLLLDNNGNLATSSMRVQLRFTNSTTGAQIRSSPAMRYKLVDGGQCQADMFLFKNMRGNFDFFQATGTKTKETEVQGVEYDRFTDFTRSDTDFGVIKGQHSRTNLQNTRKQMFTVFSQPLSKEEVNWVEELIVSPLTWLMTSPFKDEMSSSKLGSGGLVAVNIIKGSYKMHTTEKGRHFVEFKYTLSENTLVQKN